MFNQKALEDLITGSGQVQKENSRSWILNCPLCSKKAKLYFLKDGGRFACFHCREAGFQGRPEYGLSELLGRPLKELQDLLYGTAALRSVQALSINLRDFFGDDEDLDEDAGEMMPMRMPFDFYPLDHRFAAKGLAYLNGRGISLELGGRYGLRYCPSDRRVIFPFVRRGVVYGWQGRAIFETEGYDEETGTHFQTPKMMTPRGVRKEWMLLFEDRLQGSEHAILTEGPIDAIKADLCGGNVAAAGKLVSAAQLMLLRNAGVKRVYLGLDLDACLEADDLAAKLSDLQVFNLHPVGAEDLGAMSCEAVLEAWKNAPERRAGQLFRWFQTDFTSVSRLHHQWERDRERQKGRRRGGSGPRNGSGPATPGKPRP